MASLPQKSIKGAVFKTWAISSIDKLIDYLSGTFIRGGKGISVRRSAGVTIIELEKQPEQVQQNATGGATQDISATVSGGTASVTLSGSTSSVEVVGTGNVTITGNTNGQIEVGVSGGGGSSYPVWGNLVKETLSPQWDVTGSTMTPIVLPASGYLYIYFNPTLRLSDSNQSDDIYCLVKIDNKEVWFNNPNIIFDSYPEQLPFTMNFTHQETAMIPVHSGSTVTAFETESNVQMLSLTLYKDLSA